MMSTYIRCSATTRAGRPCRAWAILDSRPPLCSAHSGRNKGAGAPLGSQNARKHGFYGRQLTGRELSDLVQFAGDMSLDDEIALNRVLLQRLLAALETADAETLITIAPLILSGTRAVGRLLRDQRALSGEAADGIAGALAQALDELGTEWGIEL
jgi:hypothetical protein